MTEHPVPGGDPGKDTLYEFQRRLLEKLLAGASAQEALDHVCTLVEERVPDSLCSIMILNEERTSLWVQAAPCIPGNVKRIFDGLVPSKYAGSCGTAVFTGKPQIIEDTATDPRWADMRKIPELDIIKACWSIPVKPDADIVGSFAISRTVTGAPPPAVFRLLEAAGYVVGLAISRLFEERAAASQQEIFRTVVEDTQDCIWIKDADGRYKYVNRAEADSRGRSPAEMLGKYDVDLYAAANAAHNRTTDLEVIRTGQPVTYLASFDDDRGGQLTYHVRKQPRFDDAGKVFEIIGVARDVTEQEHAQRALQQTQKLESLGLLAGGIAHDFNNILVGILGNAEWLLEQEIGDPQVRETLAEVLHSAERASGLTNQILAYAGKGGYVRETLDVPTFVRDVLELVKTSLKKGCEVRVSFPERLPQFIGDPNQLRQVLMNLLVNASEAIGESEGHIELGAETVHSGGDSFYPTVEGGLGTGHFVALTVKDDGPGMDDETRGRVFDPFFTTKTTGRGLGLAAVLGILKAHGGAIAVDSNLGQGTCFTVYLPVDARDVMTDDGPSLVVLVVDDEPVVRNVTRRMLESSGYAVVTAADGVEAIRILEARKPRIDVALIDHNMPGLTGVETCRRIQGSSAQVPVLLATGGSDEGELANAPAPLIRKPFTRRALIGRLESLLGKFPREREVTQA